MQHYTQYTLITQTIQDGRTEHELTGIKEKTQKTVKIKPEGFNIDMTYVNINNSFLTKLYWTVKTVI